jgi:hypothetical protein
MLNYLNMYLNFPESKSNNPIQNPNDSLSLAVSYDRFNEQPYPQPPAIEFDSFLDSIGVKKIKLQQPKKIRQWDDEEIEGEEDEKIRQWDDEEIEGEEDEGGDE